MCRCPAHEDHSPSLHVSEGKSGVLVHCHAGCTQESVIEALAAHGIDIRKPSTGEFGTSNLSEYRHSKLGKPSRTWLYHDAKGRMVGAVARWDATGGKDIRPLIRKDDRWRAGGLKEPRPLLRLPDILANPDAPILISEGEKAAAAAATLFPHVAATTPAHGAKSPHKTDWTPIAGREVVIWPDNDAPGAEFAAAVGRLAGQAGAASVKVVTLPETLPLKWDLADEAPAGVELAALLSKARAPDPEAAANENVGSEGDDQAIARLAAMSQIEYERARNQAAKDLGIKRVSVVDRLVNATRTPAGQNLQGRAIEFPEPEPWDAPVPGAELLSDIAALIGRYMALPAPSADAVALWCVCTWLHGELEISTFLNLTSATKRCGKSPLLEVIAQLVHRPLAASGRITAAPLFRAVDMYEPTLIIDEADTFFGEDTELRGLVNGSQKRSEAQTLRCVGNDFEPRVFKTWCPKAIAGIGCLPDTVVDRALVVRIERRPADRELPKWRDRDRDAIERLRRRLVRWRDDCRLSVLAKRNHVKFPPGLNDRACDAWEILLAIGDHAGGGWAGLSGCAARACRDINADAEQQTGVREQLIADLREIWRSEGDPDKLSGETIVAALHDMEDRPWAEWRRGRPLTKNGLAKLLKDFKVYPTSVRLSDGRTPKGYKRADLEWCGNVIFSPWGDSKSNTATTRFQQWFQRFLKRNNGIACCGSESRETRFQQQLWRCCSLHTPRWPTRRYSAPIERRRLRRRG